MKKNQNGSFFRFRKKIRQVFLVMKIVAFLLLIGAMSVSASSYSQATKIDLKMQNSNIQDILHSIENSSEFIFIYDFGYINSVTNKTISVKSKTINEILDLLFKETGVAYIIDDRQVILYNSKDISTLESAKAELMKAEQPQTKKLTGTVFDDDGKAVPGATIVIKGTAKGTVTNIDGSFSLNVEPNAVLIVSFIGYQTQEIVIGDKQVVHVALKATVAQLDDVTVVAFAKQKKESVIGSISTLNTKELKIPSSNLTTALAGRISGLISYQRSGEPGQDDASFFVRGVTSFAYAKGPLILIDGVEMSSSDLARMQPDDIASFSIMKDATATALYGARGANGVILVTTKEGKEGKAQISFRYETSFSMPTKDLNLADPITYMKLNNDAVLTRNPLTPIPYSLEKIENTERSTNPLVYPATDWYNILFKNYTVNHRANFNVSGGGKIARYYIAGTINQDNGILNVDKQNNFNNNIDLKKYVLRSNVNINITPTTEAIVRLNGTFDDYTGPIDGGASLFNKVMRTDPVLFPPYYPHTTETDYIKHTLFGNYDQGQYINPYADMVKGYKDNTKSMMLAQFEVKQNFDFITKGLSARGMFSTNRNSSFDVSRYFNPFYYNTTGYDKYTDTYQLYNLNPTTGTDYLNYTEGTKVITATTYSEAAVTYDQAFGKHGVSGLLVGTLRNYLQANAGSLSLSLPSRNMGVSGRFTYSYDKRYFSEFNFGYNGSERFAQKERFGFFPSVGMSWFASNEKFWGERFKLIFSKLKFKATYGLVGNDAIGASTDRFFYLSEVNMNAGGKGFTFGQDFGNSLNGVSISRYANDLITWETAKKLNLGAEIELFSKLEINVDFFKEHRTNILMARASIPTTMGLQASPKANIGESSAKGIDLSADYNQTFTNGAWITARVNLTYATAAFKVYEDVNNATTPWLDRVGQSVSQQWGYIAEHLFVDDQEVNNSPRQTFGEYQGGDIKYRDINNDGIITSLDMVPIGFPTEPEIVYGFGFSSGFKGFDFSCFFQGLARESFWIDPRATSPFIDTDGGSTISKNALLQVYADNHWSESNRDISALWPRLSDRLISNNTQRSTWFMRDGSFLRLKSLEFGYTIPKNVTKRLKMNNLRIYASGTNLLTLSKFKLWDPEMGGNGLGYPVQKVFNLGFQLSF